MEEQCIAGKDYQRRAVKAEKRLSEVGYEESRLKDSQQKSRITKLERSLASAKHEIADYTKKKTKEMTGMKEDLKQAKSELTQKDAANRAISAKVVEMEEELKSCLHRLTVAENNCVSELTEKEMLQHELHALRGERDDSAAEAQQAKQVESASKTVQRSTQSEINQVRKKLATVTTERNLLAAKYAKGQRAEKERAEKEQTGVARNDSSAAHTAGGAAGGEISYAPKSPPQGTEIFKGGRQVNGRYLLFQVLEATSPFVLHFVSYEPENAQEDYVKWEVADVKRVIQNTDEFLDREDGGTVICVYPKKREELLEILFNSLQAGFKQGELILTERPEAEDNAYSRQKQQIPVYRGGYKVRNPPYTPSFSSSSSSRSHSRGSFHSRLSLPSDQRHAASLHRLRGMVPRHGPTAGSPLQCV
jgi:hypothetical protein